MSRLSVLVAFPYWTDAHTELFAKQPPVSYRLIVDSGAFTAFNSGHRIDLDDYCRFLDQLRRRLPPFHAVQLDVFGDPEGSYKNLLTMRSRGFDVMPVFTRGETLERLEEFYQLGDYLMFGGIVTGAKNRNYIKWFLNRNKGRRTHWLGFVDMDFILHYKPYSVDSSSWQGACRFGAVHLYAGRGRMINAHKAEFAQPPTPAMRQALQRLALTNDEIKTLALSDSWKGTNLTKATDTLKPRRGTAQFINTLSHVLRAYEVEQRIGTHIYLSVATHNWAESLFEARGFLEHRGVLKRVGG